MAYSKAKLKSNGDKDILLFLMWGGSDPSGFACLYARILCIPQMI
jgi:hypothetical protein